MFNPDSLGNLMLFLTTWGSAFLVALWLALIFWTYRDVKKRTADNLLRTISVIVVTVLYLPGVVIYLLMRPPMTLEEEYQQTLEEEALLNAIEQGTHCPGCSRRIKDNWLVCPDCHTRLKKPCHKCRRPMEVHWNLCPYCGTPAPGMRKEASSLDEVLRQPQPTDENEVEENFSE
jgi:cbb3-type cytochrome oxidase subunit 3/RNA polymerase subunit RPABC4/transcription elongation factor Spt4